MSSTYQSRGTNISRPHIQSLSMNQREGSVRWSSRRLFDFLLLAVSLSRSLHSACFSLCVRAAVFLLLCQHAASSVGGLVLYSLLQPGGLLAHRPSAAVILPVPENDDTLPPQPARCTLTVTWECGLNTWNIVSICPKQPNLWSISTAALIPHAGGFCSHHEITLLEVVASTVFISCWWSGKVFYSLDWSLCSSPEHRGGLWVQQRPMWRNPQWATRLPLLWGLFGQRRLLHQLQDTV